MFYNKVLKSFLVMGLTIAVSIGGFVFFALRAYANDTEPNDSYDQAITLTTDGKLYYGKINATGDEDFYKVSVPQAGVLSVALNPPYSMDGVLTLFDSSRNKVGEGDDFYAGDQERVGLKVSPGTYYIKVNDFNESPSEENYNIRINFAQENYEPNDDADTAKTIPVNQNIKSLIGSSGDADIYRVVLPRKANAQVSLRSSRDMDGVFYVISESGKYMDFADDTEEGGLETLREELTAGVYYIIVGDILGGVHAEQYTLRFNVAPSVSVPAYTKATTFKVSWLDSNPKAIASYDVQYRVEGSSTWNPWKTGVTGTYANFTGSANKIYYFRARTKDKTGIYSPWSTTTYKTIIDTRASGIASFSAPQYSTSISKNGTFKVSWVGKDSAPSSGLASYDLQYRLGGTSTWVTWKTSYTGTSANFAGSAGKTYYFRIRSKDKAGNVGAWTTTAYKTIVPYDNNSLIVSRRGFGGLYSSSYSNHYLGTLRYSTKANEYITYKATGNRFALMAFKGTGRSKAKIYIDGVYKTTIDTYSSTAKYRQVVYTYNWSTSGTHTIKIVNVGTSGRSRLDIDGLAVGK